MKKIILSVLMIVGILAVVSGSAYALFSDTVEVSGITFSTGNADLKVGADSSADHATDSANLSGFDGLTKLYPGISPISNYFYLYNTSASDIKLRVKARLTEATNWPDLSNEVWLKVTFTGTGATTGWKTLAQWNADEVTLPHDLNHGEYAQYTAEVTVDPAAGNSIKDKSLTNVKFVLTGTQL